MREGYRIIYVDETMITKSTIQTREYCAPYQRVEINQMCLNENPLAVLVGVSKEKGTDMVMIF